MHDSPQSIPPEAPESTTRPPLPTVTRAERKAQIILLRAAGEIAAVRTLLWIVHVRLGELPEDIDMGEGVIPDSVRFSVRGAIECTAADHLDAAIQALEKTARDTPESLAREWRERRKERGE